MTKNNVMLIGYYGGDKTHCLSAWQSTGIEFDYTKSINSRINLLFSETVANKQKTPKELLLMLATESHHTPFEKSLLHFQLRTDLATKIHLLKHRIGVSINSASARYRELSDQWYIPEDWHGQEVEWIDGSEWDKRMAARSFINKTDDWATVLTDYVNLGQELYHVAVAQLTPSLGRKRAKESARYFLPYAKQLDFDCQFNFRSFMHFQRLRNSDHAQKEIHAIAQSMLEQVRNIPGNPFKYSLEAFGY